MTSKFYLPSKIIPYLKRLEVEFTRSENELFSEIIGSARVFIREETIYDNWNGGTYGHDILFFLPVSIFRKIDLEKQEAYGQTMCKNLNTCAQSVENEFFKSVSFECEDETDPEFQQAVSLAGRARVNPDTLSIWKPGQIRLFISHRDIHKITANALAEALEGYGISAFVAHDTIEPMKTWQNEIIKGLETMEVMLAFVTDNFHESTWTNQEIGFALGRNIPVVSLKLQNADPSGFIGNVQALKGSLENPAISASRIYKLLAERLGNKGRLQGALITAFIKSPHFEETKERFDRLDNVVIRLSDEEAASIIRGFETNNQLHNARHLTSNYQRLLKFLNRTTDNEYQIIEKKITPVKAEVEDEISF